MRDTHLHALTTALTEGTEVDWADAEASTDPAEQEAVRQLRAVDSIRRISRQLANTWGAFELRQEIGHGRFGTVYRARDCTLDRDVALKLLDDDGSRAEGDTVIREARLLATVEHPNIVPIYGADVHDGRVGIWMRLIQGQTLKDMLLERGPFGADEAALIGRDVCHALAAVHQRGIVHRDVKAQNVMREVGGQTVLMDFGSGQRLEATAEAPLKGSPAYLAPEVVAGAAPTPQSDLYSVAVLLYHLVSGDFPVTAASWPELVDRHARGERRLLRDARPDLPQWFVDAVDRGLAADPARRPRTAGEMAALLSGHRSRARRTPFVAMALSAIIVAAALAAAFFSRPSRPGLPTTSSLAIPPFENRTGAAELDYLRTGLARQLATRLSRISHLKVVSANVTPSSSGPELAGELDVEAVLACQMSGSAVRLRLACQLRDAGGEHSVWADTSEHSVEDLVALESELATRIAYAITGGTLSRDDTRRLLRGRSKPEAVAYYLKGRHEWAFRTEESLNRSIVHYNAAAKIDPSFALAYSGLADAFTLLGAYGYLARPVAYARALEHAQRAVSLDDGLAEPYFSLAYAQKNLFDWAAAEANFRTGLSLNPSSSNGHHWYSIYLSQMGRFPEALSEARAAIALDPTTLAPRANLATALMLARRYRDSIAEWEDCVRRGSNQVNTFRAMSKAFLYAGDRAQALEFAEAARRRAAPGAADEELKADLALVYASSGRRDEALAIVDELVLRYQSAGESIAGSIAAVYTGLGDLDAALAWLDTASRDRDPELGYLLVDPRWDPLRADPRFRHLLTTVGFPPD